MLGDVDNGAHCADAAEPRGVQLPKAPIIGKPRPGARSHSPGSHQLRLRTRMQRSCCAREAALLVETRSACALPLDRPAGCSGGTPPLPHTSAETMAAAASSAPTKSLDSVIPDAASWMSDEERDLANVLLSANQEHLFAKWAAGEDTDKKHAFFEQVSRHGDRGGRLGTRCCRAEMRQPSAHCSALLVVPSSGIARPIWFHPRMRCATPLLPPRLADRNARKGLPGRHRRVRCEGHRASGSQRQGRQPFRRLQARGEPAAAIPECGRARAFVVLCPCLLLRGLRLPPVRVHQPRSRDATTSSLARALPRLPCRFRPV